MPTFTTLPNDKSSTSVPTLCRQLDELQRLSSELKRDLLGEQWFREVDEYYTLNSMQGIAPSFRPRVIVPELQLYMLAEAGDITDNSPVIYITEREHGRDKDREAVIRGAWRQGQYNLELFTAQLWANLGGTGIIMVGFDPWARGGRGSIWLRAVDPGDFYPDPLAQNDEELQYAGICEKRFVDYVRAHFPEQGYSIRSQPITKTPGTDAGVMSMPFGPMGSVGGLPMEHAQSDGTVLLRRFWVNDSTVERVKQAAGSSAGKDLDIAPSKFKLQFPNGRLIIDADSTLLYDGDNYVPHGKMPFVRVLGGPPLKGYWGVPPTRYTRSLQDLAERMYSQTFENAIRLNNGWILIPSNCGVDADKFGGLPGEITVYDSSQGGKPEMVWPQPMPAHMVQLPQVLLEEQRRLQGHTEARQGNPGAGNISEDLYEAAIGQASKLTKIRSRFFAASVQRVAEQVFYFMARFLKNPLQFPPAEPGSDELTEWKPIDESRDWDIWLDEGSIQPMSAQMLRRSAIALKQAGLYDIESTLEALGIPNAHEIADKATKELALGALTKIKKGARQVS